MPEQVTVHSEQRMTVPLGGASLQEMIVVTYSTPAVPPRQVYIDPAHDTEQERKDKIAADLKAYREQQNRTLTL